MRSEDDGFTLVELLVTVVLISVVSIITLGFMDSVTSVSGKASRHVISESEAQVVLREMTQEIRSANPISAIYPTGGTCPTGTGFPPVTAAGTGYRNCIRFLSVRSTAVSTFCNDPEVGRVPAPYSVISYGLVSGTLYKHRTDYSATCVATTGSAPGRVLLRGLTNGASKPLFAYFDGTGVKIPDAETVVNAGSVKVTLMVPYDPSASSLELTSVASFRNN